MSVGYYDALLPVREPGAGLPGALAGIRFPYRVLASIGVPTGLIVLALVSDDARLSRMFAANWARAGAGAQPDFHGGASAKFFPGGEPISAKIALYPVWRVVQ